MTAPTPDSRPCPRAGLPGCSGEVVRRPAEPRDSYRKRKTCSTWCAHETAREAGRARGGAAKAAEASPKACPSCGKDFGPRPGEQPFRFRDRETCSEPCARRVRATRAATAQKRAVRAGRHMRTRMPGPKAAATVRPSRSALDAAADALRRRGWAVFPAEGRPGMWILGTRVVTAGEVLERGMKAAGRAW